MIPAGWAILLCAATIQDPKPEALPSGAALRIGKASAGGAGFHSNVQVVAYSPDGATVAAAGQAVRLFDVKTGRETLCFGENAQGLHGLAFSPDGKTVVSGGTDSKVRFWDASGKEIRQLDMPGGGGFGSLAYVCGLSFSADGKTLCSALMDSKVVVWNVADGKIVAQFLHRGVRSANVSADGKTVVSSGYSDKMVRVWDVTTGQETFQLDGEGSSAVSPDGAWIAFVGKDRKPRLWEKGSNAAPRLLEGHSKFVMTLRFSMDGSQVVAGGDPVCVWDVKTGGHVRHVPASHPWGVSFSPDGKTLAFSKFMSVVLADVGTGATRELSPLVPGRHLASVNAVAWSPDGGTLATASGDSTVRMWDLASGRERALLREHAFPVNDVRFTPDGKTLVSAGQDGKVILWDAGTGKELGKLWPAGCPQKIVITTDGKKLFAFAEYGQLTGWEMAGRKKIVGRGWKGMPCQGGFSADGTLMVVGDSGFGASRAYVKVIETESGKERLTVDGPAGIAAGDHFYPRDLDISPDGRHLAWGCGDAIELWDLRASQKLVRMEGQKHWPTNGAVVFSPDGKLLATGGDDPTVLVREVASGGEVLRFQGFSGSVTSLAFSRDGRFLASGGTDATALVWKLVPEKMAGADLEAMGEDLQSDSAEKGYRSVCGLVAKGDAAVAVLRKRALPDPERLKGLAKRIAELVHDEVKVRDEAAAEIQALGPAAEAALVEAEKGASSAELKGRVRDLLERIRRPFPPPRSVLGAVRAVQALEAIRTESARRALEELKERSPSARVKEEAKEALDRLGRAE